MLHIFQLYLLALSCLVCTAACVCTEDDNSPKLFAARRVHSFVFISRFSCSVSIFITSTGQRSSISKWWTGTKDYHQLICHNNWVHFHIRRMHLSFNVIWFGNLAASSVMYANVSENTLVCLWGIRIHIGSHTTSIFFFFFFLFC